VAKPVGRKGTFTGTPGKHYHYAYVGNKDVKKGDWALVHNGEYFGMVSIKRVIPGIDSKVTKHVIEVLTKDEFKAYLERNQRIDELRADMDELDYRLKQHKQLAKYEELAKDDPRAKELLERLQKQMGFNTNQIEATSATSSSADSEGSEIRERTNA